MILYQMLRVGKVIRLTIIYNLEFEYLKANQGL